MVGILGAAEVLGVKGWNCDGNCGVGGLVLFSFEDGLDTEDFLDEEDSNLVRLFFFFRGFKGDVASPIGAVIGAAGPPWSIAMA